MEKLSLKYMVRLGKKIRKRRLQINLTQVSLGSLVGVGQGYLSRIELGKADPSLRVIIAIANALRMKLTDLMDV